MGLAVLLAWCLGSPVPAASQTILGQVLDQGNERPVGGAIVTLIARTGEERARTLSDSLGRFVIEPPAPGQFVLRVERFGYFDTESPLIELQIGGRAPLDLMMIPEPVGIEGVSVSVEELAAEELNRVGLSPRELGNRWIDRREIDAIQVKRDMGVILERTAQSGIRVIRPENLTMGSDNMGLCVALQRARRLGGGTCALVVLDGVPISGVGALDIDPQAIESIAVLNSIEAVTLYGTSAGAGAVLVWTRQGR